MADEPPDAATFEAPTSEPEVQATNETRCGEIVSLCRRRVSYQGVSWREMMKKKEDPSSSLALKLVQNLPRGPAREEPTAVVTTQATTSPTPLMAPGTQI